MKPQKSSFSKTCAFDKTSARRIVPYRASTVPVSAAVMMLNSDLRTIRMPKAAKQRDNAPVPGRKSVRESSRPLTKSSSDNNAMSQSWLSKLGTFFKSLSSLDDSSRDQAITVLDGPSAVDADGDRSSQASQARSSVTRTTPHDSAYAQNLRRAEADAAKRVSKTKNPSPHPPETAPKRMPMISMISSSTALRFKKYLSSIRDGRDSHAATTSGRALPQSPKQEDHPKPPTPRPTSPQSLPSPALSPHAAPPTSPTPPEHTTAPDAESEYGTAPLSPSMNTTVTEPALSHYETPRMEQDWAQRTPVSSGGHQQSLFEPMSSGHQSTFAAHAAPKSTLLAIADELPAGMDRPVWCIEDYTDLQQLHAGYASFVYSAICRHSGKAVALKIYQPDLLHQISQHQLMREVRLHVRLTHPNIIRLFAAFQQEDGVVLVQEYADGGDLLNYLSTSASSRMSERRSVRMIIEPLLHALHFIHSKFIIHRDVKLENILFSGPNMTLKLADFGLCLSLREERSVTRAGTLDYMAPEVLKCPTKDLPEDNKDRLDLAYTCAVDIWSIGVLAFELLNGVPPFTRRERHETEQLIMVGDNPQFLVPVSSIAQEFILSCLDRNPQARPSAWQLLRFPWSKIGASHSQPQYTSLNDGVAARHRSLEGLSPALARPMFAPSLKAGRPPTSSRTDEPEEHHGGDGSGDEGVEADRNTHPPHVLELEDTAKLLLSVRSEPNRSG